MLVRIIIACSAVLKYPLQMSALSDEEEALRIPVSECTGKAVTISIPVRTAHINAFHLCEVFLGFRIM